ncbi:Uma2 family endonuclease [Sphaerotilus sp.]|jgi:Uma2 family endonuclease|uniref:Uma2 family endonuclease n=1 Tax=Sphaerotilus sp. TaxID=2093942 RepID=UPI0025F2F5C8|nr:Uma2 family endonuclease [Sphaerotilus sp.]
MGHAARKPTMTPDEFLAWEISQVERHEFIEGEVYAMAGGDDRHARVTLNVAGAMNLHLRGSGCRAYSTDMRLNVASLGSYVYPDVMVTCSAADRAQRQAKSEPTLVVEVLSPATSSHDQGIKSFHYRQIPTMREIALINAASRTTEIYRRHDASNWTLAQYAPGQTVTFESIGLSFTADELFADVDEDAASATALPDVAAT